MNKGRLLDQENHRPAILEVNVHPNRPGRFDWAENAANSSKRFCGNCRRYTPPVEGICRGVNKRKPSSIVCIMKRPNAFLGRVV